jgi:hypothetical protein
MSRYDFASLSSWDLEELARDLLQAEWNVALESFRPGKARGIDLRHMPAHGGTTIVQCKHYAVSGFSKLAANLRDIELPKIERLRPVRYALRLSISAKRRMRKSVICSAFCPSSDPHLLEA